MVPGDVLHLLYDVLEQTIRRKERLEGYVIGLKNAGEKERTLFTMLAKGSLYVDMISLEEFFKENEIEFKEEELYALFRYLDKDND